jgi:hypothetical protein
LLIQSLGLQAINKQQSFGQPAHDKSFLGKTGAS